MLLCPWRCGCWLRGLDYRFFGNGFFVVAVVVVVYRVIIRIYIFPLIGLQLSPGGIITTAKIKVLVEPSTAYLAKHSFSRVSGNAEGTSSHTYLPR